MVKSSFEPLHAVRRQTTVTTISRFSNIALNGTRVGIVFVLLVTAQILIHLRLDIPLYHHRAKTVGDIIISDKKSAAIFSYHIPLTANYIV